MTTDTIEPLVRFTGEPEELFSKVPRVRVLVE